MSNDVLAFLLGLAVYLLVGQAYFSRGNTTLSGAIHKAIKEDPQVEAAHSAAPMVLYLITSMGYVVILFLWPILFLWGSFKWTSDKLFTFRHRKCDPYCAKCEPCGPDCPTCKD